MSREAWGDEGTVPSRWEETAMRQEFDEIRWKYRKWWSDYRKEAPGPELEKQMEALADCFEDTQLMMEGPL